MTRTRRSFFRLAAAAPVAAVAAALPIGTWAPPVPQPPPDHFPTKEHFARDFRLLARGEKRSLVEAYMRKARKCGVAHRPIRKGDNMLDYLWPLRQHVRRALWETKARSWARVSAWA